METIFIHRSGSQSVCTDATYNSSWSNLANSYDSSISSYATAPNMGTQADVNIRPYTYYITMDDNPSYYSGDMWTDLVDIKTITKVEMMVSTGCSDNDTGNNGGYLYHYLYVNSTWINPYNISIPDGGSVSVSARYVDVTSQRATWTLSNVLALRSRFLGVPRYRFTDNGKGELYTIWASTCYVGALGYRMTWDRRKSKSPLFAFNF